MSAGTSELFCLICFLVCSCTAQKIITAALGQDVILPCEAPQKNIFILLTPVKWNRPGLEPEYVFFNQGKHLDPEKQHPSYKNRVDLQDKEMKDGNVSLILMNLTMEDNGEYECRVFQGTKNELICSIILEVHPPGDKVEIIGDGRDKDGGNKDGRDKDGGNKDGGDMVGLIVGPIGSVIVLAVLAFIGFRIYRGCMRQNPNLSVPPNEAKPTTMSTLSESAEPTTASAPLMNSPAEEQTEM